MTCMGWVTGILFPIILWSLSVMLVRREFELYRVQEDFGTDLFLYTKGRLIRRLTGVVVIVALGATLMAMELYPAGSGAGASIYLALLLSEMLALVVIPLLDMWETTRTANSIDPTRLGGPGPRKRSRPRRPR